MRWKNLLTRILEPAVGVMLGERHHLWHRRQQVNKAPKWGPPHPLFKKMDEYSEIIRVLQELRLEVEQLKNVHHPPRSIPKIPRVPCIGVTGKGTACRNGAQPGHEYCRMHGDRPAKEVKPKKLKKEPKPKKIQPEHTHLLGETPTEACPLCDTHGDVMDPTLPEAKFESDENIEERLRILLATEEL